MSSLPLPDCNESLLLQGLVQMMTTNADLIRLGTTFQLGDGSDEDQKPIARAQLPFLRLELDTGGTTPLALDQSDTPLLFKITTITEGTDYVDMLNYWNLIRTIFFPGDLTVQRLLLSCRAVGQLYLVRESGEVRMIDEVRCRERVAVIMARMRVDTPC